MPLFEFGQLRILGEIDAGSKILQVPDPPSAAPSARCLMHLQTEPGQIEIACRFRRSECRGRGSSAARGETQRHQEHQ
jgi:hypothetical protein